MYFTIIIILSLACLIEFVLLIRMRKPKPDGLLNIDKRDFEKDYWDFVLLIPTEDAEKKTNLTIEVNVKY